MSEEDAKALVRDAILAGITNDLGSGSNVDLTVIRNNGEVQRFRNLVKAEKKYTSSAGLHMERGTTAVLKEHIAAVRAQVEVSDAMEVGV